jgi:hypothetical protein
VVGIRAAEIVLGAGPTTPDHRGVPRRLQIHHLVAADWARASW